MGGVTTQGEANKNCFFVEQQEQWAIAAFQHSGCLASIAVDVAEVAIEADEGEEHVRDAGGEGMLLEGRGDERSRIPIMSIWDRLGVPRGVDLGTFRLFR